MGQRNAGHRFLPNKFVFPGGQVDPADSRVIPRRGLRPEVEALLRKGCSAARARALSMAAIRETFEETGLLVGRETPSPPRTRSRSWAAFLANGVAPSLEILDFVARAVTPPGEPRRFDARFFMADAVHIHGDAHDQFEGSGELLDLHWVPLSDAKRLDLPPITSLVIDEISKQLAAGSRAAAMSVPFIQFPRGKVLIRGI
jgi:8-oxo-dGTP pyrophosphatase MutT (NUDIX family)